MNPITCLMKIDVIFLLISAAVVIVGKPFETGDDNLTLGRKPILFDLNLPAASEEEAFGPNICTGSVESTTSVPVSGAAASLRNTPVELPVASPVEEAIVNLSSESIGSRKRHPDDAHDSESPTQSARMVASHANGSRGAHVNSSQPQQNRPATHKRPKVLTTEKNVQSWRSTGEIAERTCEPLKVHDWNFVIGEVEKQISFSKHGREKIFIQHPQAKLFYDCLKRKTAGAGQSSVFWIPREKAKPIVMELWDDFRQEFRFPKEFATQHIKNEILQQAVLGLSKARIQLDRYPFYSEELIQKMETKLESKMLNPKSVESQNKLEKIIQFMEEVTKVSHFLILIYLSLFKEHKVEVLTPNDIENTIKFMKNLWFNIEKGGTKVFANSWKERIHRLFSVDKPQAWPSQFFFIKSGLYRFSWHFFHAWVDSYEKSLKHKTQVYRRILEELINKIIYYSNYETMSSQVGKIEGNKLG